MQQEAGQKNQQIFNTLADLFADYTFRNTQQEFFEKNSKDFNASKNEQIFQEYQKIFEDYVNQKFSKAFTNEEIQQFYQEFKANSSLYKNQTSFSDTIETLQSFTDSANFQNTMTNYSDRQNNKQQTKHDQKIDQEIVKMDSPLFDQYYNRPSQDWKKVLFGTEQDLNLYSLDLENTSQVVLKSTSIHKDISIEAVVRTYFATEHDQQKLKETNKMVEEAKTVKMISENEKIAYLRMNLGSYGLREQLFHLTLQKTQDLTIISQHSVELEDYPIKEGVERSQLHKNLYLRQIPGTKDVEHTEVRILNPISHVPKMFQIMSLSKGAKTTYATLQHQFQNKQKDLDSQN